MEVTYLLRRELILITLVGDDLACLHWEHTIALSLDQWQSPELQIDTILAFEVGIDRNFLHTASITILKWERIGFGV